MQVHPNNLFWLEKRLDKSMMTYLKSQIEMANIDCKEHLVGHVSRSLELPDVEKKLTNHVLEVAKELNYLYTPDIKVGETWVNFQKKHEFNPNHFHEARISFVIWVKVPYTQEDESKVPWARNREHSCAGCFEFLYTNTLGEIKRAIYPPMEGLLLIFPSNLMHCVYPFYTSDEERISISGNLF